MVGTELPKKRTQSSEVVTSVLCSFLSRLFLHKISRASGKTLRFETSASNCQKRDLLMFNSLSTTNAMKLSLWVQVSVVPRSPRRKFDYFLCDVLTWNDAYNYQKKRLEKNRNALKLILLVLERIYGLVAFFSVFFVFYHRNLDLDVFFSYSLVGESRTLKIWVVSKQIHIVFDCS